MARWSQGASEQETWRGGAETELETETAMAASTNSGRRNSSGTFRHKFLRMLLPFWSSALPTLPVTAPPRKESVNDAPETRSRHQRSSRMDPRQILFSMAILACIVTMGVLYYLLAQRSLAENFTEDEPQ